VDGVVVQIISNAQPPDRPHDEEHDPVTPHHEWSVAQNCRVSSAGGALLLWAEPKRLTRAGLGRAVIPSDPIAVGDPHPRRSRGSEAPAHAQRSEHARPSTRH
jgi:hypothetical protein